MLTAAGTTLATTPTSVGFANDGVSGTLNSFTLTAIPEPTSMAFAGLGLLGLMIQRRR